MMPYYVGIDGGGTKTAVELRTRGSAAHSRAVFGPLNCNSDRTAAAKTLTDTLAWLAAQPEGLAGCDGLCIGSAGISNPDANNFTYAAPHVTNRHLKTIGEQDTKAGSRTQTPYP